MRPVEDLLRNFAKCRVLVVGDLMLDDYRRGHVERISPEAPVPILSIVGMDRALGGAGNVVRNLRSLNVAVNVVGVLGEDETAQHILEELALLKIESSGIVRDPQRVSTRKIRYVSMEHGQQVFRADEETSQPVSGRVQAEIVRLIKDGVAGAQVILCSDYLKGVLTDVVLQAAFEVGREHKVPVVVAPKDSDPRKYIGATVLMPNLKELGKLVGSAPQDETWLMKSAEQLITTHKLEALVVTRGSAGMSLFQVEGGAVRSLNIPTVVRKVFDVTGAGDTAFSTFGAALAAGADRQTAVHLANAAAGIVVGKRGTASVTIEELRAYLLGREPHSEQDAAESSS